MGRYRPGRETRARIITATRRLLGTHGFDGTTLKAICDEAGVLPGSFYNLFASKDDALLEVVREAINAVDPRIDETHPETVGDLIAAYARFITGDPVAARIYLQLAVRAGTGDDAIRNRLIRHHTRRNERFAAAIARELPEWGEAGATAAAEDLLAALNGLALRWLVDPEIDFAARAARLWRGRITVN
jgi:AcrR family transcriptional regulator